MYVYGETRSLLYKRLYENNYPEDIPLISANPNNIEQKLEYILNNKHILYDISKKE